MKEVSSQVSQIQTNVDYSTMDAVALEKVLITGDLKDLTPKERTMYYAALCKSLALNPLTKPFDYIILNGKVTLYAKRDCTEQLRKINGVSIAISSREVLEDCYIVTAKATDKTGRTDESIGAVAISNLKGESRSNAMMKAETKAKRRVTLSICGLGMLDETEASSIPSSIVDISNDSEQCFLNNEQKPTGLTVNEELRKLCSDYKVDAKEFAKFHGITKQSPEKIEYAVKNFIELKQEFDEVINESTY